MPKIEVLWRREADSSELKINIAEEYNARKLMKIYDSERPNNSDRLGRNISNTREPVKYLTLYLTKQFSFMYIKAIFSLIVSPNDFSRLKDFTNGNFELDEKKPL